MTRAGLALAVLLVLAAGAELGPRYGFYRDMGPRSAGGRRAGWGADGARRVFGGRSAALGEWGAVCALLDRYWRTRCSGSVVAPRWVLTAAHCVKPHLSYVKYNSRQPAEPHGDVEPVHLLYRHPKYRVVHEDTGRGEDVTVLNHDVGLVRTRGAMRLAERPALSPLRTMALYGDADLRGQEVDVLGFGRTELSAMGEELFSARVRLGGCARDTWVVCACGQGAGARRGVCAGDSGGPALFAGAPVAVASMGPVACAAEAGAGADADAEGYSVFTLLAEYAPLINDTIMDTDNRLRMEKLSSASPRAPHAPRPALPALALLATLMVLM